MIGQGTFFFVRDCSNPVESLWHPGLNMPSIPLLPAAVAVIGACGAVYAGIVHLASLAADKIVAEYAPTTSDYEVGGLIVRLFQGILCIFFALAHTATAWAPVLAAVLVVLKHWHPQSWELKRKRSWDLQAELPELPDLPDTTECVGNGLWTRSHMSKLDNGSILWLDVIAWKKNSCGKDARAGQTSKERKQEAVKRCRCKSLKLEGRHWIGSWWWLICYPCCTMLFIRAALQSSLQSDTNGYMNTNQTELFTDWIASKTPMVSNGIFSKSARKIRSASASWHNACHIVSYCVIHMPSISMKFPKHCDPTGWSTFRSSVERWESCWCGNSWNKPGTNWIHPVCVWQLEQTGTRHGMYGISGISESICKSIESICILLRMLRHGACHRWRWRRVTLWRDVNFVCCVRFSPCWWGSDWNWLETWSEHKGAGGVRGPDIKILFVVVRALGENLCREVVDYCVINSSMA